MNQKHKIQGYLGAALVATIVLLAVTERIHLFPKQWTWDDGQAWYNRNFPIVCGAAVLYYPVIFGTRYYLKDKDAYDLGGAKTKLMINWIFWWELGLALFSMLGVYYTVPFVWIQPVVDGKSWVEVICGTGDEPGKEILDHRRCGFWIFIFCASKLVEFGDTLFVVFRKRNLILLQHYHHLATMVYCWVTVLIVGRNYNNATPMFAAMNLCVHSIMYSWYAATRLGWRSPKPIMMAVTILQIVQMVGGVGIVLTTVIYECTDPVTNYALIMYSSYFFLFSQLFIQNYLIPKATAACHKVTSKCDTTKTKKDKNKKEKST